MLHLDEFIEELRNDFDVLLVVNILCREGLPIGLGLVDHPTVEGRPQGRNDRPEELLVAHVLSGDSVDGSRRIWEVLQESDIRFDGFVYA